MTVRIPGIVKACRFVRGQLQAGILPEEVEDVRKYIDELVTQIEGLCFESGVTPEHLPTPSRNAFRYLKQIDLSNLPIRGAAAPVAVAPIHIPNVVKRGQQIAGHLWQKREQLLIKPGRRRALCDQILRHCETIEKHTEQAGATPGALELPSRQVYCWFRFLAHGDHLHAHIEALCRASDAAEPFLRKAGGGITMELHLAYINSLWRGRTRKNCMHLKCSEGFVYAPDEIWEAIFASVFLRDAEQRSVVTEFLESEDYTSVLFELQSFAEQESQSRGVVHDLEESFNRVNTTYFEEPLTPCRLYWSDTPTTSKFGHYQSDTDSIMLSSALDHVDVPAFVVDFVMFHEMLHKRHGFELVAGRRIAHTAAFRTEERTFPHFDEAEAFLVMWAERCR